MLRQVPPPQPSPVLLSPNSLSCDADDEDAIDPKVVVKSEVKVSDQLNNDDQPLDMSCKKLSGGDRKRNHSEDNEVVCNKKPREGLISNKRKLLRKKRVRNQRQAEVLRPSVISFAGGNGYSSSEDEDNDVDRRVLMMSRRLMMSSKKRNRVVDLVVHADVDEHFRRSLGGVLYDKIQQRGGDDQDERDNNGDSKGVSSSGGACSTHQSNNVRLMVEEIIRPSDVDDHFAKALGSETWSKIVNNTKPTSNNSISGQPKANSSSYKIENILGTTSSSEQRQIRKTPPPAYVPPPGLT